MGLKLQKIDKKILLSISLIFLLALFLRFYLLSAVPSGFHRDELINTYIGRFLLLNGKDLYGNSWPLFYFDKFGDYPPILPMYIMGISTFILGVSEFASRFPAAFFGALTIFPVYFLSNFLYKNKYLALLSSFFLAILPWHIVLSRMSSEGILAVFIFTTGLFVLLKGIITRNLKYIYLSFPLLLLTYFLYPSFRIFTPLSVVPLLLYSKIRKQITVLLLILFFSTFFISLTPWGKARFNQTSIFSSAEVSNTIQYLSNDEGHNNALLARIFHNKPIGYSREFLRQYFSYFSPNFLFMKGSTPFEYQVPDVGLIYVTFFILIISYLLIRPTDLQKKFYYYFLYLLLISPIPAALTIDFPPHVHRALIMTIPIVLLLPLGIKNILNFNRFSKLILLSFTLLLSLEFIYFCHQYFSHYSSYMSLFKNDGFREAAIYVKDNKSKYDRVFMFASNLPIYYLFYSNDFNKKHIGTFNEKFGYLYTDKIDNIYFVNNECPTEIFKNKPPIDKVLILDGGNCKEITNYTKITSIKNLGGFDVFQVLTNKK